MFAARRLPSLDRVYFLVSNIDEGYGICRSVVTLANRLAENHRVEIISLRRASEHPVFGLDDRIELTSLSDVRSDGRAAGLRGRLSLRHAIRSMRPGVVISTDAGLHAAIARHAPGHLITIAQEHLSLAGRRSVRGLQGSLVTNARSLDCLVTSTEADRDAYRLALADVGSVVESIPNAVPWPIDRFVTPQAKVVVSAGRLEAAKGFDRLIEAYDLVAHANPDWQFDIYGTGPERGRLERIIAERSLEGRVRLRGHAPRFHEILATASIFALASHHEGLPVVFLEAMSKGLPVVTYDVPAGPGTLVEDGVNGWLVDDGDVSGFSTALFELIKDGDLRLRMGAASHAASRQYEIGPIADRWEALFTRLIERRLGR